MYALVLTFDRYKAFAQHMIMCYAELWPDNPFIFRIPYQSEEVRAEYERKFGGKVELIKSPSGIVDTMFTISEDLPDEEWVYWCMDDRYPISLNLAEIKNCIAFVETGKIDGLVFCHRVSHWTPDRLYIRRFKIKFRGQKYLRRKNYAMIWTHQFLRVAVVREFFALFPKEMKQAKEMDYIKDKAHLPDSQRLYVLSKNAAIYGESTSHGIITGNCAESFYTKGLTLPYGFEVSEKILLKGTGSKWDDYLHMLKLYIKKGLLHHCGTSITGKRNAEVE